MKFFADGVNFSFLRDRNSAPFVRLDCYYLVLGIVKWNLLFLIEKLLLILVYEVFGFVLAEAIDMTRLKQEDHGGVGLCAEVDSLDIKMIPIWSQVTMEVMQVAEVTTEVECAKIVVAEVVERLK